MKKIILIIILCLSAIYLRYGIFNLFSDYINTIIVNLLGSIVYIIVINTTKIKKEYHQIITIAFLGSLTTFSGVFSDIYSLINQNNYLVLSTYFIITFFIIPLITYLILNYLGKERI